MSSNISFLAGHLLHLLIILAITAGIVIYLVRTRRVEGIIMLAGNLMSVLVMIANTAFTLAMINQHLSHDVYGRFVVIIQVFGLLGQIAFAGGFIMAALRVKPKS